MGISLFIVILVLGLVSCLVEARSVAREFQDEKQQTMVRLSQHITSNWKDDRATRTSRLERIIPSNLQGTAPLLNHDEADQVCSGGVCTGSKRA